MARSALCVVTACHTLKVSGRPAHGKLPREGCPREARTTVIRAPGRLRHRQPSAPHQALPQHHPAEPTAHTLTAPPQPSATPDSAFPSDAHRRRHHREGHPGRDSVADRHVCRLRRHAAPRLVPRDHRAQGRDGDVRRARDPREGPAQVDPPGRRAGSRARPRRGARRRHGLLRELQLRLDLDLRADGDLRIPGALRQVERTDEAS